MVLNSTFERVYVGGKICSMKGGRYNLIENGFIAVEEGRIVSVGEACGLPEMSASAERINLNGALVTPAFIDCHTHLVYGGSRAQEFEQRLTGVSYEEIARQGGGIMSTVHATRAASEDELFEGALKRMNILRAQGVVAFEVKSGYGLDLETEAKMLRVIKRLKQETGLEIKSTFLGAHALPPEYKERADDYIAHICADMIPALATEKLIDAVDIFVENIAFTAAHASQVFEAAKAHNLDIKIHAEQLSNMGGTQMAAHYGAMSSDHIEYLDEAGVKAMAAADMVGVLLPGAFYTLKETQKPPIDLMREAGVPMALATDHNPGSSPVLSVLLMLNMGCTFFALTPEEALSGITLNAAKALKIDDEYGSIEVGKKAHFLIWEDTQTPAELSYLFGMTPAHKLIYNGAPQPE
jgi:imidazolonepropionase